MIKIILQGIVGVILVTLLVLYYNTSTEPIMNVIKNITMGLLVVSIIIMLWLRSLEYSKRKKEEK